MSKKTFEQQLDEDMQDIIHCITATMYEDDSIRYGDEARSLELSSALTGWQHKYGDELIEEIEGILGDMARHLVENCGYEEFNHE